MPKIVIQINERECSICFLILQGKLVFFFEALKKFCIGDLENYDYF